MNVILEEALKLPEAERRKLADYLYESIDSDEQDFTLTPEQRAEIERRIEDYKLHPNDVSTWEEVWERFRQRR